MGSTLRIDIIILYSFLLSPLTSAAPAILLFCFSVSQGTSLPLTAISCDDAWLSEIDNSRDKNVAQEQRPRIVVPVHERDYALGHSSQPELKAVAHHAFKYQALLGVAMTTPCEVGLLAARLQELTRQFSRAATQRGQFWTAKGNSAAWRKTHGRTRIVRGAHRLP